MARHAAQRHDTQDAVIPDKLYFRIGDVAKLCGVEAYAHAAGAVCIAQRAN